LNAGMKDMSREVGRSQSVTGGEKKEKGVLEGIKGPENLTARKKAANHREEKTERTSKTERGVRMFGKRENPAHANDVGKGGK